MLDTSSPQPLYRQIKQRIIVGIAGGDYPTASRLPSENDLVRELGVSRMTVHRALRELTQEGVLIRVPGVGTFVGEPKQRSSFLEVRDIREEIRGRGNMHRADVLTLEARPAPKSITTAFGEASGMDVFYSVILHFEDDLPLQLERRFVRPSFAPEYLGQDFTRVTSYEYLQSCGPITEVEHIVEAEAPSKSTIGLLGLKAAEPVLTLHRRTWMGEEVVTVNELLHPGRRYSLASRYRYADRPDK